MIDIEEPKYTSRVFLNDSESGFTGTVQSYYGESPHYKSVPHGFFAISDCNVVAKLHLERNDKLRFAKKLRTLSQEAIKFAEWLEDQHAQQEINSKEILR